MRPGPPGSQSTLLNGQPKKGKWTCKAGTKAYIWHSKGTNRVIGEIRKGIPPSSKESQRYIVDGS